jgi:hypothetical protein
VTLSIEEVLWNDFALYCKCRSWIGVFCLSGSDWYNDVGSDLGNIIFCYVIISWY